MSINKTGLSVNPLSVNPLFDVSNDTTLGGELIGKIKQALGYLEKPLVKCSHCGQWGAVYCECVKCGAPIDPKE